MQKFDVILGYNCNYQCSHCGNNSSPGRVHDNLDHEDKAIIKNFIEGNSPQNIAFAGGEPTLYLDLINEIISYYPTNRPPKVHIVTNGWFGASTSKIESVLHKITNLGKVNLSFDIYHNSETKIDYVKNIYNYCESQGIDFQLMVSVTNPEELLKIQGIATEINIKISVQEVVKSGRAASNNLTFYYPRFQVSTLDKKCPSEGRLVYHPKRGFSTCCSSLAFNDEFRNENYVCGKDIDQYISGDFYKTITSKTFRELAESSDVSLSELKPEHSHPCNLCSFIFDKKVSQCKTREGAV